MKERLVPRAAGFSPIPEVVEPIVHAFAVFSGGSPTVNELNPARPQQLESALRDMQPAIRAAVHGKVGSFGAARRSE